MSELQSQVKNAATDQLESESKQDLLDGFGDWAHSNVDSIPEDLPEESYDLGDKMRQLWKDFQDLQSGDQNSQLEATGDLAQTATEVSIEDPVIGSLVKHNLQIITAAHQNVLSRLDTAMGVASISVSGDPDPDAENQLEQDTERPEYIFPGVQSLVKAKANVQAGVDAFKKLLGGSPQ
jgi:hypothetical protein